jgi:hypothetical protein
MCVTNFTNIDIVALGVRFQDQKVLDNQSIKSINQSTNQAIHPSIHLTINKSIDISIDQPIKWMYNQSIKFHYRLLKGWRNVWDNCT